MWRPMWHGGSDIVVGVLASIGAVALVSVFIGILDHSAQVLSLGALYVFAVLPRVVWGLAYALPVAVASMLAFNWFFLHRHTRSTFARARTGSRSSSTLSSPSSPSELAARARRRRRQAEQREREAALLAEAAASLLGGGASADELDGIAARTAGVLGVSHAWIASGRRRSTRSWEQARTRSRPAPQASGRSRCRVRGRPTTRSWRGFLPGLASLLAVALDRERARARGPRGRGTAAKRRDQDDASAGRLARPPLAADRDRAAAGGLEQPELELDEADRADACRDDLTESRRLDRDGGATYSTCRACRPERSDAVRELWSVDELVGAALDELHDQGATAVDLPIELPPVEVDAAQTRRVLVNLLENAHRHSRTAAGGPRQRSGT